MSDTAIALCKALDAIKERRFADANLILDQIIGTVEKAD
jgi:hypothetical protein